MEIRRGEGRRTQNMGGGAERDVFGVGAGRRGSGCGSGHWVLWWCMVNSLHHGKGLTRKKD